MTRSAAVTIILSLTIGCVLSQMDMISEPNYTPESGIETTTGEACYDSGWSTKCECPESSPNLCGHTLTTICYGEEDKFSTENLTRAECYVPGEWADWAEWAICNTTCPETGGWRNRTRECGSETMKPWQNAECNGTNVEWQECACGEWGSWSDPSTCSATCDGGYKTRQRQCRAPASLPGGAGVVCEGDAEEVEDCNTDECPLDEDEAVNGVYVCLDDTDMDVPDYLKIRPLLQKAIILMINSWCYRSAFNTCCPSVAIMPTFPKKYVPEYVNNQTLELKGAFRDYIERSLCFFMMVNPQVDTCELCKGLPKAAAGRKKRQTLNLAGTITNAVASSDTFSSAVASTVSSAGFNVTVQKPLSPSAAASLKATLLTTTTTIATTVASNATTARATAAPPSQLGLIVGLSVGGGLILITIILVIVVVVKKKMAKTGIAEITASGAEGAGHQHERRHRELEDGNVAYPAPQYPARGAVAPVSQS